jgi:hypothetical protein
MLGLLFLGFQDRTDFHPEHSGFLLWRRQLEAALLGLRRASALAAGKA